MSNEIPQVSVLLPFHRIDAYLFPAIASVLNQSLSSLELLLIADGRLPAGLPELESTLRQDTRLRLIHAPPVGGLAFALNLGIAAARGEYIARMDGDDVSLPDRLEQQVCFLNEHPEIAALGGRLELIDEHGTRMDGGYPFYETDAAIRRALPLRNPMPHPAMMFRKQVLLELGGYKYAHSAEDWELFLRMARNPAWKLHNLDATLVRYRRHPHQVTRPEMSARVFQEVSGFLCTEFLRTGSLRYLCGIAIKFPPLVRLRHMLGR